MVLLLCTVSVFEIYSATLHTKYAGFHTKQFFWIAGGLAAMFLFSKIDYHRLLDWVPWAYGVCLRGAGGRLGRGPQGAGRTPMDQLGPMHFQPSEWVKLILILVVARYFANLGGRSLTWKDIFKAFALVGIPHGAGASSPIWEPRSPIRRFWSPASSWAASTSARR